jgi:hypothetical protein
MPSQTAVPREIPQLPFISILYLVKNGYRPEATITLEQNGTRSNTNRVKLEFSQNKDGTPQVLFGGNAVVRVSGEYRLF